MITGAPRRRRLSVPPISALWPVADLSFESGPGWAEREPVEVKLDFIEPPDGQPFTEFSWQPVGGPAQSGKRIDLPEVDFTIPAGELELRSRLVLPLGEPPFPAVVLVHGSGAESAVDTYSMPYLFAAHGILLYEGDDPFDRRYLGYAPGYLDLQVQWLRRQSGLEPPL